MAALVLAALSGAAAPSLPASAAPVVGGAVQFSSSHVTVEEGSGTIWLTVQRDTTIDTEPGWVDYEADGGTAGPDDHTPVAGSLRFDPGQHERRIAVTLLDDAVTEDTESLRIRLSRPRGSITSAGGPVTLIILDDDQAPVADGPAAAAVVDDEPVPDDAVTTAEVVRRERRRPLDRAARSRRAAAATNEPLVLELRYPELPPPEDMPEDKAALALAAALLLGTVTAHVWFARRRLLADSEPGAG